nr:LCP family protein [Nocardioides perillae]
MALVTGLSVVYLYRELSGNLNVVEVGDRLQDRPDVVDVAGSREPLNVLVMGSDTREGEGNDIDGESGAAASDTTILFHFSADRERAYGVSIPRDSMVDRPACDRGEIPAEDYQMWNEAFSIGGPACTIQQFEQLTDLRIDHYVVLDFNGFRDMVDAVDGVQVCIPETIDDREHGIYLEEGTREIRGKEALNYVRQRYAVGNGSDIGRMKRQQAFIASMAAKVLSADTLSRPDRLISFASAATRSLTVDPGLGNIGRLAGLAQEFQGIGLDKIKFMTVPWQVDPQDSNRIVWTDQADVLWRKMRNDEPLSRTLTGTAISAADVPGGPAGPGSGAGDGGDGAGGGGTPSSPSASPQQQAAAEQARQEALDAGLCV